LSVSSTLGAEGEDEGDVEVGVGTGMDGGHGHGHGLEEEKGKNGMKGEQGKEKDGMEEFAHVNTDV